MSRLLILISFGFELSQILLPLKQQHSKRPEPDLRPEIVDSLHHQTLVTKQLIPAKVTLQKFNELHNPSELQKLLEDKKLVLSETISLEELRVLVKNAKIPDTISQNYFSLDDACQRIEQESKLNEQKRQAEKNQRINIVTERVSAYLLQHLERVYPTRLKAKVTDEMDTLQAETTPVLTGILLNIVVCIILSPNPFLYVIYFIQPIPLFTCLIYIIDKYDPLSTYGDAIIQESIRAVNHEPWKNMKNRFFLAQVIARILCQGSDEGRKQNTSERSSSDSAVNGSSSDDLAQSLYIQRVHDIFFDDEKIPSQLCQKYLSQKANMIQKFKNLTGMGNSTFDRIQEAVNMSQSTTNPDFWKILEFSGTLDTGAKDTTVRELQTLFFELLKKWAETSLVEEIKLKITARLETETISDVEKIQQRAREKIIEEKENCRILVRKLLMEYYCEGYAHFSLLFITCS